MWVLNVLLGLSHSKLILVFEQVPLFRIILSVRDIENDPHILFDHMLLSLVFIFIYGNFNIFVFRYATELCIFAFGSIRLSLPIFLYLLAA